MHNTTEITVKRNVLCNFRLSSNTIIQCRAKETSSLCKNQTTQSCSTECLNIQQNTHPSSLTSSRSAPLEISSAASSQWPPQAARVRGDSKLSTGMLTCRRNYVYGGALLSYLLWGIVCASVRIVETSKGIVTKQCSYLTLIHSNRHSVKAGLQQAQCKSWTAEWNGIWNGIWNDKLVLKESC